MSTTASIMAIGGISVVAVTVVVTGYISVRIVSTRTTDVARCADVACAGTTSPCCSACATVFILQHAIKVRHAIVDWTVPLKRPGFD